MKSTYQAALAVICVLGASGLARGQDQGTAPPASTPSISAISATSMGSMPTAGTQTGSPAGLTRAQLSYRLNRKQDQEDA